MIDLVLLIDRLCASHFYCILILPQHTLTFTDEYDSEKGGFSQVKYRGPTLSVGLKTDAMAICNTYAKLVQKYNEGNVALKDSDLLTEANTCKQAVTNCVGGKLDSKNKH